jgi:hypothetical protein
MVEQADAKYLQPIEQPESEKDPRRKIFPVSYRDLKELGTFYTLMDGRRTGLVVYSDDNYADLLMDDGTVEPIQLDRFNFSCANREERSDWCKQLRSSPGFKDLMTEMFLEEM